MVLGVTSMAHWIMSAIAIIAIILAFSYSYYLLHLLLTITKCPDCGRIMQRVKYTTERVESEQSRITYECRFCQAKRIKKGSTAGMPKERKLTLYP